MAEPSGWHVKTCGVLRSKLRQRILARCTEVPSELLPGEFPQIHKGLWSVSKARLESHDHPSIIHRDSEDLKRMGSTSLVYAMYFPGIAGSLASSSCQGPFGRTSLAFRSPAKVFWHFFYASWILVLRLGLLETRIRRPFLLKPYTPVLLKAPSSTVARMFCFTLGCLVVVSQPARGLGKGGGTSVPNHGERFGGF